MPPKKKKNNNTRNKNINQISPEPFAHDNFENELGYAKIITTLGDCRFTCLIDTGQELVGRISGRAKKRGRINVGDIVLVSKRDFETGITRSEKLDILHSDIQGFEIEMLLDAPKTLSEKRADYIFLSTHLQAIHTDAIRILESHGYRIEVSSDFDNHTTSHDGFILATSPNIDPVFTDFKPLSRLQIEEADLSLVNDYLSKIANWQNR